MFISTVYAVFGVGMRISMYYPDDTVEEIRIRSDIVSVIALT